MPAINIIGTGRMDARDSAFPQTVQLPDGDLLCSFNVGGEQARILSLVPCIRKRTWVE